LENSGKNRALENQLFGVLNWADDQKSSGLFEDKKVRASLLVAQLRIHSI
jgi:hypothetical protein